MRRTERKEGVLHLYVTTNLSLREIGMLHGITGARVQQIAKQALGDGHATRRPPRPEPVPEQVREKVRCRGAARLTAREREAWMRLPVPARTADKQAYRNTCPLPRREVHSMDDLLRCLKQAACSSSAHLSTTCYDALARAHGWPTSQTVIAAFGSWNNAKRTARLPVRVREGDFKEFSAAMCLASVASVVQRLGRAPSIGEYTRLRPPGAPSLTTVKRTLLHLTPGALAAADWRDVQRAAVALLARGEMGGEDMAPVAPRPAA